MRFSVVLLDFFRRQKKPNALRKAEAVWLWFLGNLNQTFFFWIPRDFSDIVTYFFYIKNLFLTFFFRSKHANRLRAMLCTFNDSETGRQCGDPAMPFVKFCQQHIRLASDQLLFTMCSALESDNSVCRAPVLDQTSDHPLCLQHKRLEVIKDWMGMKHTQNHFRIWCLKMSTTTT